MSETVHILYDIQTNRILHITEDLEFAHTLSKIPNTQVIFSASKLPLRGYRFIENLPTEKYYYYVLTNDDVIFDDNLTDKQLNHFTNTEVKIDALLQISRFIDSMRSSVTRSYIQSQIHNLKYEQAKAGSGQLVSDWADIKGYTIKEACKDIILNHEFQLNTLYKSEAFRQEYTNKIIKEQQPLKMLGLVKEFRKINYGYV
jgi:hypothetical protein